MTAQDASAPAAPQSEPEKRALVIDEGANPDLTVAGLPLLERWRRSLGGQGFDVEIIAPGDLVGKLQQAAGETLVTWAKWVVDPASLESLILFPAEDESETDNSARAWTMHAPQTDSAPAILLNADGAKQLASAVTADALSSEDVLSTLGKIQDNDSIHVTAVALNRGYWGHVDDSDSARAAKVGLLKRLRWRQGGVVAHYLNRPVSGSISYFLVETPITPNQVTIVTFLIGVAGVVQLIDPGGYWGAVWGLLLLHINSIFDGIDGEMARLKHQSSNFGSYLDSVCDESLNAALMIAVGYNLTHRAGASGDMYLYMGIFSGAMAFIYAAANWHCKLKHGLGLYWWFDAYKPRRAVQADNSAFSYFKRLFSKDGLLFLFLIAGVTDLLVPMLWISTAAGVLVAVLFFIHIVIKRARW